MCEWFNDYLLQNNADEDDILYQKEFINYLTSALLSESFNNDINICKNDITDNVNLNITSDTILSFKRESLSFILSQQIIINS